MIVNQSVDQNSSAERVYRVGRRWHWSYPATIRRNCDLATMCASHPISRFAADLAPPEVDPAERCRGHGCRERWLRVDRVES